MMYHTVGQARVCAALAMLLMLCGAVPATTAQQQEAPAKGEDRVISVPSFELVFDREVQTEPFSGRVLIVVSRGGGRPAWVELSNWFSSSYILGVDVKGAFPGEPVLVSPMDDESILTFPGPLSELEPGRYWVQAVVRRSRKHPAPGHGAGDLLSRAVKVSINEPPPIDPDTGKPAVDRGPTELRLAQVVEEEGFRETERVKEVRFVSTLLSQFHHREMEMKATVILPAGWSAEGTKRYPVLYFIPGFGGTHHTGRMMFQYMKQMPGGTLMDQLIFVVLDPTCYYGHSVFADSDNNGPWGKALVTELIPHIEETYHGTMSGDSRFVTGVSSGGWSSLWLQITYPDSFAGCWAHVPDPVDFRQTQQVDIYAPNANMFRDAEGNRIATARQGEQVMLWCDDFVHREAVIGAGGQMGSLEATFGTKGRNGEPMPLFDRKTGAIDPAVAEQWQRYDIRMILEKQWETLGPKLGGKLHVFAGGGDNFFLNGAVALLKESLAELGSDAQVEVIEGMPHMMYVESVEPMLRAVVGEDGEEGG
ncbi:MAG: hypothetical protein HND57_13860 [Planctomycetes bacterium]|nr:hypothetical protein [Planctomycetota bacterium]